VLPSYTTFRALFATTATPVDPDGYEPWPYATKMRSGGFTGGFSGILSFGTSAVAFPFTLSVDGQAVGAVAYDIYLSQRTDDTANQYFTLTEVSGKSGTWTLALTSVATSKLGLATATTALTPTQGAQATRNVHLYVRRLSDGAIQWASLFDSVMGS
jgi:hypothetical protein